MGHLDKWPTQHPPYIHANCKNQYSKRSEGVFLLARVNIESQIWSDTRVLSLAKLLGESQYSAIGRLARLWHICGEMLVHEMPKNELNLVFNDVENFADMLVESRLASHKKNDQIRIAGAEERIQWLIKLRESAKTAGRKSGQSRRKSLEPSVQSVCGSVRSQKNPLTLTLTPAPTLTPTPTQGGGEKAKTTPTPQKKTAVEFGKSEMELLEHWSKQYAVKNFIKPTPRNESHVQEAAVLLEILGGDLKLAKLVVSEMFEDSNSFYAQRGYTMGYVINDVDKLQARAVSKRNFQALNEINIDKAPF